MKIKTVPTTKLASLCTALIAALLMFADKASAVSIRDAQEFGLAKFGSSSRSSDGSIYVRHLIGMALRSDEKSNGQYASDKSPRHVALPNRMNVGRSIGVVTIPTLGGVPIIGGVPHGRVPDGGITAMLLGTALGALGMARRYIGS